MNQRSEDQDPNGTCPEPAIQFTPQAWGPRRVQLPNGQYAIAIANGGGALVFMPVAEDSGESHYERVRRGLLNRPGTAMVSGQESTGRCCGKDAHDGVLIKTWTPEYLAQVREDHPGQQDEGYIPVMVMAVDDHEDGRTAGAIMSLENFKQLHNRMSEVIAATEAAHGRSAVPDVVRAAFEQ